MSRRAVSALSTTSSRPLGLLATVAALGLGCRTVQAPRREIPEDRVDRPTTASRAPGAVAPAGTAPDPADGADGGGPEDRTDDAHSPAPASTARRAAETPPPSKPEVAEALETLLTSLEPSRRVQVLLVDDGDCLDPLARTGVERPAAVELRVGTEDSVTSSDPSDEGFAALRSWLSSHRPPPDRRLVVTRLYGEHSQIGWLATCVLDTPFLTGDDLLRHSDATSLTFGLTRAAEDRLRAHEPTTARLAFTLDGWLVLALAPLDALRLQQDPFFTLYRP